MSFHNKPDYRIPELTEALKAHRLPHDTPSRRLYTSADDERKAMAQAKRDRKAAKRAAQKEGGTT